jgi:hypothetical protein
MEAAGIEPASGQNPSIWPVDSCVKNAAGSAGTVLVHGDAGCLLVSQLDSNLQSVVLGWDGMSVKNRQKILALIRAN